MKKMSVILAVFFTLILIFTNCSQNNTQNGPSTPTLTPTASATTDYAGFVTVPGGTFTQADENANTFTHTVSAFKISRYEVTYELWYSVRQWALSNGYAFSNPGREGNDGSDGAVTTTAKNEPVTMINWRDAIVWCNAYSQQAGLIPVYYTDAGFTVPVKDASDGSYGGSINNTAGSFDNPYVNWTASGYRLPTEGEWSCAAMYRDGASWTPADYASGAADAYSNTTATGLAGWDSANSGGVTHDAGGKTANMLGIFDMAGNVIEWCWDWKTGYAGSLTDYRGPASGTGRTLHGGSYLHTEYDMQLCNRYSGSDYAPYFKFDFIGFRLAKKN